MKKRIPGTLLVLLIIGSCYYAADCRAQDQKAEERFRLLRHSMIRRQIEQPPDYREPVRDRKVLQALFAVPRHRFVQPADISLAYEDHPLPIGHGQTISQPYIVALMTALLDLKPEHKVLEIGTGSGYQAAVLSHLTQQVYSMEIIEPLAKQAAARLKELGYGDIRLNHADGYFGWPEQAPFDRIIVTCAASLVPPPLLQQLKNNGKMCIPVGDQHYTQYLTLIEKSAGGKITMRRILPVLFVPLIRSK